jgi:PAS domain S-box-containing protein
VADPTTPERDVTTRRSTEEHLRLSEERFRLLVEGVKDYAIFMLDASGHVFTWNAGAEHIKGYRAEEIIGEHFSRFYPEEDVRAGKCEMELEVAARDGRLEDEGWRVRKDGTQFWASVIITALYNGKGQLAGFGKVTRDLTERRKLEDERLRLAHAHEAIRLRDEFLNIASHELKTPLTTLQLQLQSLRLSTGMLEEKTAGKIDRAIRSGHRLTELIETLLDVSRITTGRLDLHPHDLELSQVVLEVVDRFRETASKAGCELGYEGESGICGHWDRIRLEQVVTNLLANALKYGAGAPVSVTLARVGDEAVLEVRDRGSGIAEKDLVRIFERFERASSLRHYGGLGLGLYVTRQIVEAHGGQVNARNDPTGGALLTVRLPVGAGAPAALPSPSAGAGKAPPS